VSKPYRTTLNFNTNHADKAMALEWLHHLQQMHPELSISDIVSRLLIDDRSRTLEVHDTTEVIKELTNAIREMTMAVNAICENGIVTANSSMPIEAEKPKAADADKVFDAFGF